MGRSLRCDPLTVLTIAASLAWMGCQPAVQPPAGNQKGPPLAQKKTGPKFVRSTLGDDWFRTRLLVAGSVQKDLGLTAEQIGKIRDWVKVSFEQGREFWAKSREILPPSQHFTPDEYEARRREFRALAADAERKGKEMRTKLLAMLTPSQSARLEQIQLQRSLAATLARPEIIKALDISQEQSGRIRALRERTGEKWSAESPDLRGLSRKERRQKMIEFMGIPGFG